MISTLKDILKDDMERLFFYEVCVDFLKNSFSLLVASIYKFWGDSYMDISKKFYNEESPLFIQGLLKLENKGSLMRTEVSITQKGQALLLGEYFPLLKGILYKKSGELTIIENKSIKAKELFYNKEDQKQIDLIKEILGQGNLNKVQKQFSEKGLPKGLAI